MSDDDRSYFRRRAETQIQLATQATRPDVVAAHYQLATAYLEKVDPSGITEERHHA